MLQGNFCFPNLSWVSLHCPMAIHYLFVWWSVGYNYSSSLAENALLIQCRDSECGMKNGFQPLQEVAAAASQESPRNPVCLQGSQLVSQISYLGYRATHTSEGNSGQCQLGGNLVPRPIVLLLGILRGCRDCSMWGWRNLQIQCPRWQNYTSFVSSTGVPMLSLPFCTANLV